jgi:hypothetical protein
LIDQILSTYPADDVAYAWQCLERNGGVEALFLTYYADSAADHQKRYQNFRLEGPAAVFYFRGAPHVHAFINVTMDGDRPLSVGELLAHNTEVLEGAQVKRLFEAAMQAQAGTDVAYFHEDGVAGRLLRGPVRTGDIYALESWQDHVTCVEIRGSHLSATLVEALRRRGIDPDPRKTYSVATTGYVADERAAENLGRVESQSTGGLLRDVTIAHLREHGMPAQS